jgi:hypothetical protein
VWEVHCHLRTVLRALCFQVSTLLLSRQQYVRCKAVCNTINYKNIIHVSAGIASNIYVRVIHLPATACQCQALQQSAHASAHTATARAHGKQHMPRVVNDTPKRGYHTMPSTFEVILSTGCHSCAVQNSMHQIQHTHNKVSNSAGTHHTPAKDNQTRCILACHASQLYLPVCARRTAVAAADRAASSAPNLRNC